MRGSASKTVDIKAELALGIFGTEINLTGRRILSLRNDHELVYQFLHACHHFFLGRQDDLAVVHIDRAFGDVFDALPQDFYALAHLEDADGVAVIAIAFGADGHIEVEPIVNQVGMCLAHIMLHPAAAEVRAGQAEINRLFPADHADILRAFEEDGVACEQSLGLFKIHLHLIEEFTQLIEPPFGQITSQATHARIAGGKPRAGQCFD